MKGGGGGGGGNGKGGDAIGVGWDSWSEVCLELRENEGGMG